MSLPVEFPQGSGITRDASETGAFFVATAAPAVGERIAFDVVFGQVDRDEGCRLRCLGEVVRVEGSGPAIGVAVKIHSYRL